MGDLERGPVLEYPTTFFMSALEGATLREVITGKAAVVYVVEIRILAVPLLLAGPHQRSGSRPTRKRCAAAADSSLSPKAQDHSGPARAARAGDLVCSTEVVPRVPC